jgi:AraC-like DNA-binding protein
MIPSTSVAARWLPGRREHVSFPPSESTIIDWLRPYVRQAGDDVRPPWLLAGRKLLDFLLVAIGSGEGRFTVGEETFPVGCGDLVWIPPDTVHEMEGTSTRMRCVYLHFDLVYARGRSDWDACIPGGTTNLAPCKSLLHPPVPHPIIRTWRGRLPCANFSVVISLMQQIVSEHKCMRPYASLSIAGMMTQLVAELLRGAEDGSISGVSNAMKTREAAVYLAEHADESRILQKLAFRSGLSSSHFRKIFRETQGISLRKVRQGAIMRRASEMLIYSPSNVSEIAHALGFSNVHNFSRSFRKFMGMSPRDYKKGRPRRPGFPGVRAMSKAGGDVVLKYPSRKSE